VQTVVIDMNLDAIAELSGQNRPAIYGDATQAAILEQAGIDHASHLILTMSDSSHHGGLIAGARSLNPEIKILARTRYIREQQILGQFDVEAAVIDEIEAAVALTRAVLAETGAAPGQISAESSRVRDELRRNVRGET
jgi:CPA2 family monovalent cation:H+ antiporter-2